VYYTDKVITDPTIFNFYKQLLDGPNKHEWKNWTAFNFAVDQTFFDDRLGFELAYDQQKYTEGDEPWLEGENYAIGIDINATYANGAPNPNVGRPDVAQAASGGEDNNYQTTITRQTWRFTPTVELRAADLFGNSTLSNILGKSILTGLYEKTNVITTRSSSPSTRHTRIHHGQQPAHGEPPTNAYIGSTGSFEWLAYIGPSLADERHRRSGANLNAINYVISPRANETTLNFNSTWNKPTDPNTPGYVNPGAPYTYTNNVNGS
jgi:hypothetical protein